MKKLKMMNVQSKRWLFLFCALIVWMPMLADMRFPILAEQDTVKIPSDTTQIDTTGMRDTTPPVLLTPSIPASPQAEAFQRLGNYSVNNASGMPDISIPLFEIDHCGYKIPLALRYMAKPLKPGYNYDVTGHGWTLTIGSCISRTITSLPDEDKGFKLNTEKLTEMHNEPNGINDQLKLYNWQFDKFNAVLPDGRSFYFYISKEDNTNTIKFTVSDNHFKNISLITSGSIEGGFILYDENGVKYTFNIADNTIDPSNLFKKVAWYLSKIEIPNISAPIQFYYDAQIVQPILAGKEEPIITLYHDTSSGNSAAVRATISQSNPYNYYKTKLLTKIQYGPTQILFGYQYNTNEPEYNYMTSMTISDNQNTVRSIQMQYSTHSVMANYVALLNKLTIAGPGNTAEPLVYDFEYTNIENSSFKGTDLWGNCSDNQYMQNVANMNFYAEFDASYNSSISQLIRNIAKDPTDPCPYQKFSLTSSTTPNEPRRALPPSKHGVLSSITYPTGGSTLFEFENHRFVSTTDTNGDYIATKKQRRIMEGGGFRIKSITNMTSDGTIAEVRQFRYGPTFYDVNNQHLNLPADPTNTSNKHVGFGEPVVDPNILTFTRFNTSSIFASPIPYMLLGLSPSGQHVSFNNPFLSTYYQSFNWRWDCHFSPIFFRALLQGHEAVVYPEITEYMGNIGDEDNQPQNTSGKTVYKFDIYNFQGDSTYYMSPEYCGNVLVMNEAYAPKDYITEKTVYKYNGASITSFERIEKEKYTYNSETHTGINNYIFKEQYSPGYYPSLYSIGSLLQGHYCFVGRSLMTAKSQYQFFNGIDSLSYNEWYDFNEYGLMTTKNFTGNKQMTTTYVYPSTSDTGIPGVLASRNMMSTVLQSKTRSSIENQQFDVSGYKTDYDYFNNDSQVLPSKAYNLNTTLTSSSFEEIAQVKSYTSNGHPIEVVDRSGVSTFYLWSYNDRYIVAEIKNATATQVNTALSSVFNTNVNGLAAMSAISTTSLNNLRNNSALSSALVTTWTYSPLVGVKSQTDPSGVSIYYSYDSLGRLKEVYRYEGNTESSANKRILNQYTYHTKNN